MRPVQHSHIYATVAHNKRIPMYGVVVIIEFFFVCFSCARSLYTLYTQSQKLDRKGKRGKRGGSKNDWNTGWEVCVSTLWDSERDGSVAWWNFSRIIVFPRFRPRVYKFVWTNVIYMYDTKSVIMNVCMLFETIMVNSWLCRAVFVFVGLKM